MAYPFTADPFDTYDPFRRFEDISGRSTGGRLSPFPDYTTFPNQIPVFGTPPFNPNAPSPIPSRPSAPSSSSMLAQLLPYLIAGGSTIGAVLSNTPGARTSTSFPTVSPEYKTLNDLLRARAVERLNSTTDLSGFEATGIGNINETFRGIGLADEASLTSRGLGTSPVAATVGANRNLARGGQIAQFQNRLPLIQRQFQNEDFTNAMNLVGRNTGTTNVGAGSAAGAGIDDLTGWLGYLNTLQRLEQLEKQRT